MKLRQLIDQLEKAAIEIIVIASEIKKLKDEGRQKCVVLKLVPKPEDATKRD